MNFKSFNLDKLCEKYNVKQIQVVIILIQMEQLKDLIKLLNQFYLNY